MNTSVVVDDDAKLRDLLNRYLTEQQFEVTLAADSASLNRLMQRESFDLIILDQMLPGEDGLSIIRRLRAANDRTPIIMLTAKDSEVDKVVGLEIGADDYVTKPYSYRELLARVHAVLRRSQEGGQELLLTAGRVVMDVERHEVRVDGESVTMPLREFELLELFLRHPDRVLARSQIIEQIWGANYVGDTKTLDVHVKRIRAKIEVEPGTPRLLTTVRGLGYMLVTSGDAQSGPEGRP